MSRIRDSEQSLNLLVSEIIREGEKTNCQAATNTPVFNALKGRVKSSNECATELMLYLLNLMESSSCNRRRTILSLMDFFFNKSHCCREVVVGTLETLLRLVCESDPMYYPLPPPMADRRVLKEVAVKTLKQWHSKYAVGYERLGLVKLFLEKSNALDYHHVVGQLAIERERTEAERVRQDVRNEQISDEIVKKFEEVEQDISRCLTEVDSAINILVPPPDDENYLSSHCLAGSSMPTTSSHANPVEIVLTVSDSLLDLNEDNIDVAQALLDARKLVEKYRFQLLAWLRSLSKVGARQEVMERFMKMKSRVDVACSKVDELKITQLLKAKIKTQFSDDEDEFEDVAEKQLEEFVPPDDVPHYILEALDRKDREQRSASDVNCTTSSASPSRYAEEQPCCSKSLPSEIPKENATLSKISGGCKPDIPVVSFDLDLLYWTEEVPKTIEVPRNDADSHRFWRCPDDDGSIKMSSSAYFNRVIDFSSEPRPISRPCRAPLKNGTLCKRMDRVRCPFHGVIVERDELGIPTNEQGRAEESAKKIAAAQREEDELTNDVERELGVKLSGTGRKRKIDRSNDGKAVRERLEKKLFDRASLRRVADTLNAIRLAKIQKIHGHQFVHAVSR